MAHQMIVQSRGVLATLGWSGGCSAILYWIVDLVIGLRVSPERDGEGLDSAEHSERAYKY